MNDEQFVALLEQGDHDGAKQALEHLLFSDWKAEDEAGMRIMNFLAMVKAKNKQNQQYKKILDHALDTLDRLGELEHQAKDKKDIEAVRAHIEQI